MRNKLLFFAAAMEYIWRFKKHYVSVLFFSRLNSCILSVLSLQVHFSQISDHSCDHSLDSFHLSMFFLTSLSKPSTPVLSWMQNTLLLWKATFLYIIVSCLPLEQCHETVDSHSVCEPLNPLLQIWHPASLFLSLFLCKWLFMPNAMPCFPPFDWINNYQFSSY